jgi:alanyl-tRNA synthetase
VTQRLYYTDSYLRSFRARVVEIGADGRRVYLDRSAFYPASGGQPHDLGRINGSPVIEVIDEGDRMAHLLAEPVSPGDVECAVDWDRRFDHMQQHTGQHLLSAVFIDMLGAETVSFHMGSELSTVELAAEKLDERQFEAVERRANEIVTGNRPVTISFEDAQNSSGLRKASERTGTLRIVSIDSLDRSACGGTHVRSTGEIGAILIRGTERIRGNLRVAFVCGLRAVRRARADFSALSAIARSASVGIDDAVAAVGSQLERAAELEKTRRKLAAELAVVRGRELFQSTDEVNGRRNLIMTAPALDEDLRVQAQAFAAQGSGVFAAICEDPPSILVAASAGSGVHAGNLLKPLLAANGGRGGGSAQMAQGSLPDETALARATTALRAELQV